MGWFSRRRGALIGVDMAQDAVRLLQLACMQGRWQITHYAREPLPHGAVVDGQIEDVATAGAAVARAVAASNVRGRAAAVAVPAALLQRVALPAGLPEHELEALAELEARDRLPSAADDICVDFAVLGPQPAAPEQPGRLDVLLAAARATPVRRCVDAIKRAGLTAQVVDVDVLARARAEAWIAEHPQAEWALGPGVSAQALAADAAALPLVCGLALRGVAS